MKTRDIYKDVAEAQNQIKLGPQLFVSRQTTMEGIKPRAAAWTSTAQKTSQGYTSEWVEWCKDNMAQWVTDTGILYDVAPGARILLLRTDRDVIQVARQYGLKIKNSFELFEKMDWNVLRQDYDAIHHIPQGRDYFMSAWDVESTAWFDRKFLTNPRQVKVDTGKTQNIGKTNKQSVSEVVDPSRRGFLASLAGFAAVSAMPPGLVSALSTPEGIQGMSVSDVSALLKAIRAYLPPYDQEDWTGTFERWYKMAAALRIPDDDLDAADKLDRLMRQYRRDPEAASAKLLRHLQRHAVDLTDVRGQTIGQWDDVATVSKSDPVNDEIRQMQQQIADYLAKEKQEKISDLGQIQTATSSIGQFRDLVQRVMAAGTAIGTPSGEKTLGKTDPDSSTKSLPALDQSATDIMAQLRDVVGRDLTNDEKNLVKQEINKKDISEGTDPRFVHFMNQTLAEPRDPRKKNNNPPGITIMSLDNMPGYREALRFGMRVIGNMDLDTRNEFLANPREDAVIEYLIKVAKHKGLLGDQFEFEDLDEVQQEFPTVFHDPTVTSWRDVVSMAQGRQRN